MGLISFIKDVHNDISDMKISSIVENLMKEIEEDPKNPESRKKIAEIINTYLAAQKTSEAQEIAEKFAALFGVEFLHFFMPVCAIMNYLDGATYNASQFDRKYNPKACNALVTSARKMDDETVDPELVTNLLKAVLDFKEARIDFLRKGVRNSQGDGLKEFLNSDTASDRTQKLIRHIDEVISSLFVYKCVAYNKEAYNLIGSFSLNQKIKKNDYAIPGPAKATVQSRFTFMQNLSYLEDFDELFAIYALICGYQAEKGNKVSVSSKGCKATVKLSPGLLAKKCSITFKFSGKKHRQFILSGKIDLKKKPDLLDKSSSFKLWKISEKKPSLLVLDYKLKDAEFFEKRNEIQSVTSNLNSENKTIFEALSAK